MTDDLGVQHDWEAPQARNIAGIAYAAASPGANRREVARALVRIAQQLARDEPEEARVQARAVHEALAHLPLPDQRDALVNSIIESAGPNGVSVTLSLISTATDMARIGFPPEQRQVIAERMRQEADALVRQMQ
jgi:hypothetical protein